VTITCDDSSLWTATGHDDFHAIPVATWPRQAVTDAARRADIDEALVSGLAQDWHGSLDSLLDAARLITDTGC
jgi:hypothetical protein